MMAGLFDNGKAWQHAGRIDSHVGFCGGFLATVLCPVNAIERKLQCGRIDRLDLPAHPGKIFPVALATGKARADLLKVLECFPVELFGDDRISCSVRV
jgi:hypothetical protein